MMTFFEKNLLTLNHQCRIRLHVKVLREDIDIFMEWWNNDMSTEHIISMSNYFQQTLTRVLVADDMIVSKLRGIVGSDWDRIYKFNAVTPETHDRCIHEIIHEQALLQPEREAVCAWDGSLSYRELDLLASQLAYYLQVQGVGPEVRVALCFDKSVSVPRNLNIRNEWLFCSSLFCNDRDHLPLLFVTMF